VHVIGQTYDRDPGTTIPLPPDVLAVATLVQLARAYGRDLDEFARLNPGLPVDEPLRAGTPVNVPDPGFPPLLASRLAARALADATLSPARRRAAILALVPVAADAPDATALDAVLARLLLASGEHGGAELAALIALSAAAAAEAPPDAALAAQLTSFVP
jgi:hypothetical protein